MVPVILSDHRPNGSNTSRPPTHGRPGRPGMDPRSVCASYHLILPLRCETLLRKRRRPIRGLLPFPNRSKRSTFARGHIPVWEKYSTLANSSRHCLLDGCSFWSRSAPWQRLIGKSGMALVPATDGRVVAIQSGIAALSEKNTVSRGALQAPVRRPRVLRTSGSCDRLGPRGTPCTSRSSRKSASARAIKNLQYKS